MPANEFVLPSVLVGRTDLARLVREVETLDSDLESQKVRAGAGHTAQDAPGPQQYTLPPMSRVLTDFLELNQLDVHHDQTRMVMKEKLRKLKDHAPVVHMTFAVEADPDSVQRLVGWLRENAHPQTLISVGLQPSLIAGVYLRTPNQVHDYSLKALFGGKHSALIAKLEELAQAIPVVPMPTGNQDSAIPASQTVPAAIAAASRPEGAHAAPQEAPHG